ncbi:MAG: ribonuclease R [Eubacteriales bacterium]|nr:ribonuclease R [Eubacteriales bacterium]
MTREEAEAKKSLVYDFITDREYMPMSVKEMAMVLQVPAAEKKDLRRVIEELASEGKLHITQKGKVQPMADHLLQGRFMATQRGFGFVRVEGEDEDYFIAAHRTLNAMDGDTVRIAVDAKQHGKRKEAEVVSVLERGNAILVGTYSSSKSYGFVVADNQKFTKDIYIAKADTKGAITGHKVVVEITDYGDENRNPEGRIIEIIGHINDPGVDILSVIKAYGLPEEYPDAVMDQVKDIPEEVAESEKAGRADYRGLQTVTIDGEDAKDLDDAITLTKEGDLYHLGVHIADVSQYVTEYSPLDKEAVKRGTSVYLVDRVIPMLPHKLSNGICSLNQGVDRLTLSCMMTINAKGEIIEHSIEEAVINVNRRMSYTSVNKIIELEDPQERQEYQELIPMFALMYELAAILRKRREKRGSIDFDFPESKIILDPDGKPLDVMEYERNNAHRIIEEFMLAANQTVAEEYFWQELPFVYRVHETPDSEKIQQLSIFIHNFGYTIKTGAEDEIHPKEIQKLVAKAAGTPEEGLISRLALRSMKQAKYTTDCEGHFGLAMKYYCHFTSPIRRYPDLQIHRIIKENIHGRLEEKRISHYQQILPDVTAEASRLERRADDAEREVEKMKKAEYMEQFIGESFDGVISGVTTWGMYVELPNTIEGMIHVADIPGDYYYFEEEKYQMVGERTGKLYKLGEPLRITVSAVDKLTRSIDFVIADAEDSQAAGEDSTAKAPASGIEEKQQKAEDAFAKLVAAKRAEEKE